MHLAEGIISSPVVLGGGAALAGAGVAIGLRNLDEAHALRAAVLGSGFFVASLIHIPLFGVSVHMTLTGLLGIVLGWAAFPAVLVGLVLQLVLFGFGGLTTLGLNTCIMAVPAVCVYHVAQSASRNPTLAGKPWVCGLLGAVAVALSALLMAAVLRTAGEAFLIAAWSVLVAHVPVMILEAGVTAGAVSFLGKVSPELLAASQSAKEVEEK
jgi:cobalt/nickel transport system permease protein